MGIELKPTCHHEHQVNQTGPTTEDSEVGPTEQDDKDVANDTKHNNTTPKTPVEDARTPKTEDEADPPNTKVWICYKCRDPACRGQCWNRNKKKQVQVFFTEEALIVENPDTGEEMTSWKLYASTEMQLMARAGAKSQPLGEKRWVLGRSACGALALMLPPAYLPPYTDADQHPPSLMLSPAYGTPPASPVT
ncbi:Proteasome subunit alpha type-4 [Hypoxylon texense]